MHRKSYWHCTTLVVSIGDSISRDIEVIDGGVSKMFKFYVMLNRAPDKREYLMIIWDNFC